MGCARGSRQGALDRGRRRPAWLRRLAAAGAVEVELIAGEDGVSPGSGLRVLRCGRRPGARARRRHHQPAAASRRRRSDGGAARPATELQVKRATVAEARDNRQRRFVAMRTEQGRWSTANSTEGRDREGLCGLGAGLRSGVRRGFRARPQGLDRGGRAHRRAHPRCRRRHRHFAGRLFAPQSHRRRRSFRADAAQGAGAGRAEHQLAHVEALAGDGCASGSVSPMAPSTSVVAQFVITTVPGSRGDAR